MKHPTQFEVYLVDLEPSRGAEIKKARPCAVVSPDQMNANLKTALIAPMTTAGMDYPTRIPVEFGGKRGRVALDQIRAVDRIRLLKKLGALSPMEAAKVLRALAEMFAA